MTITTLGQAALDYFPCRYGTSKLLFRGPRRRIEGDYVAFLGGTELYGRFIEDPLTMLVEHETTTKTVNLACANAGLDIYLKDASLQSVCRGAKATVIQLMGAHNMSNRFYTVHPRRNDRFVRPSEQLEKLYPEVDFTEFHFTRHMLQTLEEVCPRKFAVVRSELQQAWVARMRSLIEQIEGPVVLLWMADHAPDENSILNNPEPLFVGQDMIDAVSDLAVQTVEVIASQDEIDEGIEEMVFEQRETPAARGMLGPVVHRKACAALVPALKAAMAGARAKKSPPQGRAVPRIAMKAL